ncbi:hypothetical protein GUITHDRAFT_156028 [Guillardia theta CCMP2712]|uniref:Uncharacterized protein n=1 Tax=Guillardia theta (strain CCMP2712) TaxID=905079 RepID=L1ICB3_GUITC|nr:hypothetical protein GUITHDRAFT_156028 [Guillardia theta CCMP2712]EKX33480.1 hypothetical protein GUITHDRAFT_156028 [Guillardia theta CCMP2712]|eukprot:XP_005820460.1 hypothetical protein GUITHDRAFT_156028 [Guillardia theta CCMP2712]
MDQAPEAVKYANQTKAIIPQRDTRGSVQGGVVHPSEGGRESPTSSNQCHEMTMIFMVDLSNSHQERTELQIITRHLELFFANK